MPVPKYRTSRAKGRARRNHWRQPGSIAAAECPHCHETKRPHRACPHCGYYNGIEIVSHAKDEKS